MKKFLLVFLLYISTVVGVFGQTSSRNTYSMPGHDTIKVLIVFAELGGDFQYDALESDYWKKGALPRSAEFSVA